MHDNSRKSPSDSSYAIAGLSAENHGIDLPALIDILRRRMFAIAAVAALGIAVGILAALLPYTYTSSGRIQVRPGSSNMYRVDKQALLGMADSDTKLESEVAILQSDTLLLQVAKELNLQNDADFIRLKKGGSSSLEDPTVREKVLRQFSRDLSIRLVPRTEIIVVSCTTRSPKLSARIVDTLINDYIGRIFKTRYASAQRVAGWLSEQLTDLKKVVEGDQERLVDLQKQLGVVGIDQTHNIVTAALEDLTKSAAEAKVERIIAEARYRILENSNPDLIEGGPRLLTPPNTPNSQSSLLAVLRARQAQISSEYAQLRVTYGPNYPDVKQVKAQLDEANRLVKAEQDRVLSQAREAYQAAKSNESMTDAALAAQKQDAFRSQSDMVQYAILQHDYNSNRLLYEGLMRRLREAGIESGLESSEVDIVDLANIPGRPAGLSRPVKVVLGGMLGFLAGIAFALFLEGIDTRISSVDDLERISGLPSLAVVPIYKRANAAEPKSGRKEALPSQIPEMVKSPNSIFTEAILGLRSSLLLSNVDRPPQVVVVTSALPGEGKSTIALNEACALSQLGMKVLLIDCDLRRPSIHVKLGVTNRLGLTSVLTGKVAIAEAQQSVPEIQNLVVMTSGPLPPSPANVLASHRMIELVAAVKKDFDCIVIDCPPALSVTDATLVSRFADAIVLVVRLGLVNRKSVRRVRDLFNHTGFQLSGFVLNAVDLRSLTYGDAYYMYGSYGSANDETAVP